MKPTDELTFLRGIQFTDAGGQATFATIFPGFYMGRTNHIHFKVRVGGRVTARKDGQKTCIEGHTSHIGQIFFPEEFIAGLMRTEPYVGHAVHRTTQAEDDIYQDQHGAGSIARLSPADARHAEAGYIAELIVAVDPSRTPAQVGFGGPPLGVRE
jgi:protocatechuate 3,4-dioxygenase beta subunit